MSLKRISIGAALTMSMVLSMGMSVFASKSNATTSFDYNNKTVNCLLSVDWKAGKDDGYAKTYMSSSSDKSLLGAYCNAYKNGTLLGGANVTSVNAAQTSTISYTADKFKSVHNVQNSDLVPQQSTNLSLSN